MWSECPSGGSVFRIYAEKRERGEKISYKLWKELNYRLECEYIRLFVQEGRYLELDRSASLVKSTISIAFSHDGRYFASTHGDHSVKVFEWPSGKQIATLEKHRRTPWTVKFHPFKRHILASGCIGNECCVWDLRDGSCVRSQKFPASISCLSFHPNGELIAVSSGSCVFLWRYGFLRKYSLRKVPQLYNSSNTFRSLFQPLNTKVRVCRDDEDFSVLESSGEESYEILKTPMPTLPYHMVQFHPSGQFLLTGEKNRSSAELQFSLRFVLHRFDLEEQTISTSSPVLIIPRAIAYNDAGVDFSPCGKMIVACVPEEDNQMAFQIAIFSLVNRADGVLMGDMLYSIPLDSAHLWALTNLKFSSSGSHLLAGFSFRSPSVTDMAKICLWDSNNEFFKSETGKADVIEIHHLHSKNRTSLVQTLQSDVIYDRINYTPSVEDEINVALFSPGRTISGVVADGLIYGTQKGRIRLFQLNK
ncbi:transducin family protein / WD-40 repeat family protein [Galdieria sulphuraria]|uniref:Transducin family protein / WD-40 repeat family protein n=1 Tax=Galdieria sulphuraria TaxID=130081 RepID=M2XG46_GALSU|nr:transducin family protein / WD-40 repeat family protein [Galdieria sulphuraria]EME29012.1 transducin family protein / WD-40 repeat family protein [Galdieria sulphuraria]|eukprot:XP_005705532.1 transducin family protein / WD-40 repeat family protein [Galdieria sulphuraria]